MVQCEACDLFYHVECINKTIEEVMKMDNFYCPACFKPTESKTKSKKLPPSATSKRKWGGGKSIGKFMANSIPTMDCLHGEFNENSIPAKVKTMQLKIPEGIFNCIVISLNIQ